MKYDRPLLIVDDDEEVLKIYAKIFELNGFLVIAVNRGVKALEAVLERSPAVVVSDIIMPGMDGMELLTQIKMARKDTEVIMLTAEGSVAGAVEAVRQGAFTYLVKPVDIEDLIYNVEKAFDLYQMSTSAYVEEPADAGTEDEEQLIGNDVKIQAIRQKVRVVAPMETTVLITGESGTGKEIVANLVHQKSGRTEFPFIRVNCAALSESILESELFGHEKGAFTGADRMRKGRFEMAAKGTLLLDEIGELSLSTQAKLLRVLQEKEFERVGSSETMKTDFRLIASTNRNLLEAAERGLFRRDLYYRINVLPIFIPPLRERKGDIPILTSYFISAIAREFHLSPIVIEGEVMDCFLTYQWPGNVRELKNVIERLVVMAQEKRIGLEELPDELLHQDMGRGISSAEGESLIDARKEFEKNYILKVLEEHDWNITRTASALNIARKNLYRKLKEYGIAPQ